MIYISIFEGLQGIPFPFIFNGRASETYGLSLAFTTTNYNNVPSGSGLTLQTDRVERSAETMILGEIQDQVLQFPIEIWCDDMDVYSQIEIKKWLFGQVGYKKLQICIDNYNTFYFNCKIQPNTDFVYSRFNGFSCTVVCDSPYAWEFPKVKSYSFPTTQYFNFNFINTSGDLDYLYPVVQFQLTSGNTNFSLVNITDNNRTFTFTGLAGGETITVDNKNKIITSSRGINRLGNFNKKFSRMLYGTNQLQAIGTCTSLKITYQNARRLGGAIY